MSVRPIIDAGPGLNFLSINKERLLIAVLGPFSAPETVQAEVLRKSQQDDRFRAAATVWRKLTVNWIQILSDDATPELATVVQRVSGLPIHQRRKQPKDLGETMVIAHAVVAAESGQSVTILMDDGPGAAIATSEISRLQRLVSSGHPVGWHCCVGRSRVLETGPVTAPGTASVFAGFRFPREVISVAVRWYLRYGLSYRDVEELLAERGVTVDHVTVYRWVQRFTPEFIEAARLCRHAPGDRWFVDETYLKVAGKWTYLYRAVDQHGQVIDVLLSVRRDLAAARRFFARAVRAGTVPVEVTTDRAPVYPRVLDELVSSALHIVGQYANNPIEADHGRLKARLRPMRGVKRHRSARTIAAGHAFVQNMRRGHYDIATEVSDHHRLREAFDDLAITM